MIGLTKHFLIKTGVSLLVSAGWLYVEYKAYGEYSTVGRLMAAKKEMEKQRAEKMKAHPIYADRFEVT